MKKVTLRVKDAKGKVVDHLFSQESIMVGSGASAHLQLSGEGIANLHAMIKIEEDGSVTISDLGTDAGTVVNEEQINDEVSLKQGAKINVGDTVVYFLKIEEEEPVDAPVDAPVKPLEKRVTTTSKKISRGGKGYAIAEEIGDIIDAKEARKMEQPELYEGKTPPPPQLGAPSLATLTDSNKALEVLLIWNNAHIKVNHYKIGKRAVCIGTGAKVDFNISDGLIPQESYDLVVPSGQSFSVIPLKEMVATVESDTGDVKTISDSHLLALNEQVTVRLGEKTTFQMKYIPKERKITSGLFSNVDYSMMSSLLISVVFVIIAVALVVMFAPKMFEASQEGIQKSINKFTKLVIQEEKIKEEKVEAKKKIEGEKRKDPSHIKDANKNKTKIDREKALNAGILGILQGGGAVSSVFGAGGLGVGISSALGGLHGTRMGAAGGLGGLGSRGAGAGGGGSAVGIGGIGLGAGGKYAGGYGAINLGGTGKSETRIRAGRMILKGGLDKDVIQKVVRRHYAQIKYCYEKELAKNPNLYGKISVNWTIGPDGRVQVAQIIQSDMNNVAVEDCIVRNVRRWKFPKPKGGGVVVVTYPFVFQSGGG